MTTPAKRPYIPYATIFVLGLFGGFLLWKYGFDRPRVFTNSLGMGFRRIPAGTFTMGTAATEKYRDADEDEHEVEISKPFHLGVHEVTQQQFQDVMGFNPSVIKLGDNASHPVENVSWNEANDFCQKLSALPAEVKAGRAYRLPTEAEWEYACRAGDKGAPFGFTSRPSPEYANLYYDRDKPPKKGEGPPAPPGTAPVGSTRPNAWGLYDMHGNVWEWCNDWYDASYYQNSPKKDPPGPATGTHKVTRGGSHCSDLLAARSANRVGLPPDVRSGMGFRVVMVEGANK